MLYVVATPIGNLADITLRALETLKSVDLIACEDTRNTRVLLSYYEIKKPIISYHQHSKISKIDYLAKELEKGKNIALVTDSGTPGVSDPGGLLIKEAVERKIEVITIPGPSALTAIVSIAGIDLGEFLFIGFLPKKKGRQTKLKKLSKEERPIILYESPHRIIKTLNDLKEYLGDREIIIGRELTKKFEETYRGKISEILPKIKGKGEFVIIVNNKKRQR